MILGVYAIAMLADVCNTLVVSGSQVDFPVVPSWQVWEIRHFCLQLGGSQHSDFLEQMQFCFQTLFHGIGNCFARTDSLDINGFFFQYDFFHVIREIIGCRI